MGIMYCHQTIYVIPKRIKNIFLPRKGGRTKSNRKENQQTKPDLGRGFMGHIYVFVTKGSCRLWKEVTKLYPKTAVTSVLKI